MTMQYCFHHIPKTAGSSLQLRLSHRESIGQLPKGSTLIVYPLYQEQRFYRVSQDIKFNPKKPIKEAFLRTYKQRTVGNASIVMGHYTNVTQPGKHYTWLRHPLHRDISHFNYDCEYGHQLIDDFVTHLSMIAGNFLVLWLYGKYLGRKDLVPIETKYKIVKSALHNFEKVYDSDKFENSWKEIAKELNVSVNPRLDSNRVKKDYKQKIKFSELSEDFKFWHKNYNKYDYLLYEEFCA